MSRAVRSSFAAAVGVVTLSLTTGAQASLVFHAGFNEGTGNPSGTYLGAPVEGTFGAVTVTYSSSVSPVVGSGNSIYLPGSNQAHAVDFTPLTPLNDVDFSSGTVAAWINMESFASTGGNRIFTTRTGGGSDAFDFYIYNPIHATRGGYLELHAGNGTTGVQYNTGASVFGNSQLGNWYFVAVTWDSDADIMSFYVGNEAGVLNHVHTINSGVNVDPAAHGSLRIGGGAFGGNVFNGLIDEFYLYNHALTANELAGLMVPEPASAALIAAGALLLMRRRR